MRFGKTLATALAVSSTACGGTVLIDGSGGAGGSATVGSSSKASVGSTSSKATVGVTASVATTSTGPSPPFIEQLEEGPWLVGWSGGLDHYSWVRFLGWDGAQGQVFLLDPMSNGMIPLFYMCQGQGSFTADVAQTSVTITFPPSCALPTQTFYFSIGGMPNGLFPQAVMGASVVSPPSQMALDGARFPAGFCTAPLASCPDPAK